MTKAEEVQGVVDALSAHPTWKALRDDMASVLARSCIIDDGRIMDVVDVLLVGVWRYATAREDLAAAGPSVPPSPLGS